MIYVLWGYRLLAFVLFRMIGRVFYINSRSMNG